MGLGPIDGGDELMRPTTVQPVNAPEPNANTPEKPAPLVMSFVDRNTIDPRFEAEFRIRTFNE